MVCSPCGDVPEQPRPAGFARSAFERHVYVAPTKASDDLVMRTAVVGGGGRFLMVSTVLLFSKHKVNLTKQLHIKGQLFLWFVSIG